MRVPLTWLHEYVDFDLTADDLVEVLSLHSQEVDGVEQLGVLDGEVVVGEVQEFGPHPNADRLFVARVDVGGQVVQIVAGAPNPYPGVRVSVVLPGSLMSDGTRLKKAKLRGLESYGMMMSERELGISPDHSGILLLDEAYEIGRPVADYFPVGETDSIRYGDQVIAFEIYWCKRKLEELRIKINERQEKKNRDPIVRMEFTSYIWPPLINRFNHDPISPLESLAVMTY